MSDADQKAGPGRPGFILLVFLVVGLVHALLYVFIVPPWQHYDEPNHFEAVWLTAKLGRSPVAEDSEPELSRAVVQSMIDHEFFTGLPNTPDLSGEGEVHIPGYAQFEEPPLYYYLASLPLRYYTAEDIADELRAVRLVSVLLYLATIVLAWDTMRLLTPRGHPLRWLVPATLVLLPSFTDLMTAVNNDTLSVAAFSFFFWAAVRLLRTEFNLLNILLLLVSLVVVYFSKNTAYVAFLLTPIVLIAALYPARQRRFVWPILFAVLVLAFIISLRWDDATFWHRTTAQAQPMRQVSPLAIHGEHALVLETNQPSNPFWAPAAYQLIPLSANERIQGDVLTFGVWMWADAPATLNLPAVNSPDLSTTHPVEIDTQPRFFSMQVPVTRPLRQMWIELRPTTADQADNRLYYDGFVLADGEYSGTSEPQFEAADAARGTWDGRPFNNLVRNGSMEKRWPHFDTRLDRIGASLLPDGILPTLSLNAVLDWSGTRHVMRLMGWHQLRTFWATFGWGHVNLEWPSVYIVLLWITLLGFMGSVGLVIHYRCAAIWDQVWIVASATLFVLLAYWSRAIAYYEPGDFYFAPARHIFPAIIPILTIICFGLLGVEKFLAFLARKFFPGLYRQMQELSDRVWIKSISIPMLILITMLLYLSFASIVSILDYYA